MCLEQWRHRAAARCLAIAFSGGTAHAETCGIDSIFANDFETPSMTGSLDSTPGALQSPGIPLSIVGPGTFSIAITFPASSATVLGSSTPVAGTFSGPTDTGIMINGVQAYLSGNQFFAPAVPVGLTPTALTATATKLTGETSTATVSSTGSAPSPVSFGLSRPAGFAPMRAVFAYTIGALPAGATVTSVAIDYTADGIDDVINPPAGTVLSTVVSLPGVYHARLTVHDSASATYTADAYYAVRDGLEVGGMLCDVYGYMKQRLSQSTPDVSGALNAIHPSARDDYQAMFIGGAANLPTFVANLGSIGAGTLGDTFGTYLVVRKNPDQTLSGFHIEFSQDAAGVWRISNM